MSDKTAHLVAHVHPFAPSDRITREIAPGQTVEQIVAGLGIKLGNPVAYINGNRIIREAWCYRKAFEGDHIVVKVVPAGGQGSDTSNALHKGAGIATLAGFGLFVAGFFTAGATWGIGLGLAGAGLLVGLGTTAVDNTMAALKAAGLSQESILSIRGGSNQTPTLGTKIPVILGKHLITPYYAARPYTNIATVATPGDTQYLHMLFCLGVGPLCISQIKIGENLLASNSAGVRNGAITVDGIYTNVQLQIYQNGTSPSLYPYTTIEEQPGIELKSGVEHWLTTAKKTDRVHVDITLPSGLYQYNDSGEKLNHSVTIEVRRRAVGSGTAWASCTLIGTFALTQARAKTMRFDLAANLTAGQYEIGMKRITADDPDGFKGASMVQWSAFRSQRRAEPPVDAEVRSKYVFLAVYIKATAQLSGVISQLNCIAESEIPIWDGATSGTSGWATAGFSQNPAALYLWALRGPMNPRPVPDASIDWPRLEALYASCAAKGWTCNAVIASDMKLRTALAKIASTARSTPTIRDGLYSVVVDEEKADIAQHFTPRNVRNFSWSKAFSDLPYGLLANFVSADDGYDDNQRIVPYDGYTEAEAEAKLESIDLWGITNPTLVYKHGRYRLAVAKLRPEVMTFETDAEGIVCEPGDLVVLSHDAIVVGHASGRVKYVQVDVSGNAVAVTVDELVTMADGGTYGIRFRRASGESVYTAVTTVVGETNEIEFAVSIAAAHVPAPGDLFTFGVAGIETARCIVAGIEPMDDLACRIYLVDEAPGVHTADSGDIPEFNSRVSPPASAAIVDVVDTVDDGSTEDPLAGAVADALSRAAVSLRLSAPSISRSRADALSPAAVTASAKNADGTAYAGRLILALSYDGGSTWSTVYTSSEDESSHEYTVPATIEIESVAYYVTAVRASLYAAGGTTTLLREVTVPVALDSSASAINWGVYDSVAAWPAEGMIAGDFFLDGRAPVTSGAAEGGVMRRWDGDAWIEYLSTDPGYDDAYAKVRLDLMVWAKAKGVTTIAAVNAIFRSVAASQAFLDELKSVEVEITGTLKTGVGASDNARVAIQDSTGVISNTFSGAGTNDLAIAAEGATAGTVVVAITEAQVGDTGPSGGKVVSLAPVIEASPSDLADAGWDAAVSAADAAVTGGKGDWSLPTRGQLQAIRTQLGSGIRQRPYWTNDTSGDEAYTVDMETGAQELWKKSRGDGTVAGLSGGPWKGILANGDELYLIAQDGATVTRYNPVTGTSSVLTPPHPVSFGTGCGEAICFVYQDNSPYLEVYDQASGNWLTVTMPVIASRRSMFYGNGKVYIAGVDSGYTMNVFDVYTISTEVWTRITLPFESVSGPGKAAVYNNKAYFGMNAAHIYVMDLTTDNYVTKAMPLSSMWHNAVRAGRYIVFFRYSYGTGYAYNIDNDQVLAGIPGERETACACGDLVYSFKYLETTGYYFNSSDATTGMVSGATPNAISGTAVVRGIIYAIIATQTYLWTRALNPGVRPIRSNTETKRWTHALDGGTPVAHGPIVAGAIYDTAIDIKVSWPAIAGHVVGDTWTIVQDSMIGLSVQDPDGVEYLRAADGAVECLIDQGGTPTMARMGAGIIESGYVSGRGWYIKYGDGKMEQRQIAQRGTSGYQTWTYPVPFSDTDIVVHVTGNNSEVESIAGNAGTPSVASCRWNCTRTDTGGYPTSTGRTALTAIGRWNA